MAEIVCIGQAVVDCITRGIDRTYPEARSGRAESITLYAGGDALNESVILTRLGHHVRTVCFTGEDLAGTLIRATLKEAGADISGVQICDDIPSVVADIIVENDGSRRSINSRAIALGGKQADPAVVKGADIVSLASICRAPLDDPSSILTIAKAAKAEGAILCCDTKVPNGKVLSFDDLKEVLKLTDYILPNETEAMYLTGLSRENGQIPAEKMADIFLNAGVGGVIIKLGPEGLYYADRETAFFQDPLPGPAVDSTGAGDNFASGFLCGIADGFSPSEAVRLGGACAALCVGKPGATGAAYTKEESLKLSEHVIQRKVR